MKTEKKHYEQPSFEVIKIELKYSVLTDSLGEGSGQAGEGDED